MSASALATLTYDQAQKALDQQERQVIELRQRAGTLLGVAALTASLFALVIQIACWTWALVLL